MKNPNIITRAVAFLEGKISAGSLSAQVQQDLAEGKLKFFPKIHYIKGEVLAAGAGSIRIGVTGQKKLRGTCSFKDFELAQGEYFAAVGIKFGYCPSTLTGAIGAAVTDNDPGNAGLYTPFTLSPALASRMPAGLVNKDLRIVNGPEEVLDIPVTELLVFGSQNNNNSASEDAIFELDTPKLIIPGVKLNFTLEGEASQAIGADPITAAARTYVGVWMYGVSFGYKSI